VTDPGTSPQLDVYDIAYLAAGPDRVVDTALVALVETGRVRVQPPGQLTVAELARRHPVEAAVLDAVGTRGHRSVDVVRWRLADDDRVFAIGRRLVAAGLLSRWVLGRRRTGRLPVPTTAGRQVLRDLAADPPTDPASDGGTSVLVALHGRDRLSDELRRSLIFESAPVPTAKERAAALRHRLNGVREYHPGGPMGGGGGGGDGGG
jgi:hypothetical protein